MRRNTYTILFILAFVLIKCAADNTIEVEKLTLKQRIANGFEDLGDRAKDLLHRKEQEPEPVIEEEPTLKERAQEKLQRAQDKLADGYQRVHDRVRGAPEEPVVEAEPTFKEKVQETISNLGDSFNSISDRVKHVFVKDDEPVPEVVPEAGYRERVQEGLHRAQDKLADGYQRVHDRVRGAPEEPVVEAEPTMKEKIQETFSNLGDSVGSLGSRITEMFSRSEDNQEAVVQEAEEKKGYRERLQTGFQNAGEKVKGVWHKGDDNNEQVQEEVQDERSFGGRVVDKAKKILHLEENTMPPKAGEAAGSVRETLHHAKEAVKEGAEAYHADGFKDTVHHVVDAARELWKGIGSGKDAAVETNEVPVEGGKDSVKEGIKLAMSKENIKGKYNEAKEFMKREAQDTVRNVKERIHGQEEPEVVEEPEHAWTERFVDALHEASRKIRAAVGLAHEEHEKSEDL